MENRSYLTTDVEWSGWPFEKATKSRDPLASYDGYVYVIEFTDGWIKVGCSNNANRRLMTHAKEANLRDARIVRAHISKPHKEWRGNEEDLIAFCRKQKPTAVNGNEYFRGLAFRKVADFAANLRQDPTTPEDAARYQKKAEAFMRGVEAVHRQTGAAPKSAMQQIDDAIGELFVALARSKETLDAEASDAGRADELWDLANRIAEQRECRLESVLENNPIDLLEHALVAMVETHALRLLVHAREQEIESLTMPLGEAISAAREA